MADDNDIFEGIYVEPQATPETPKPDNSVDFGEVYTPPTTPAPVSTENDPAPITPPPTPEPLIDRQDIIDTARDRIESKNGNGGLIERGAKLYQQYKALGGTDTRVNPAILGGLNGEAIVARQRKTYYDRVAEQRANVVQDPTAPQTAKPTGWFDSVHKQLALGFIDLPYAGMEALSDIVLDMSYEVAKSNDEIGRVPDLIDSMVIEKGTDFGTYLKERATANKQKASQFELTTAAQSVNEELYKMTEGDDSFEEVMRAAWTISKKDPTAFMAYVSENFARSISSLWLGGAAKGAYGAAAGIGTAVGAGFLQEYYHGIPIEQVKEKFGIDLNTPEGIAEYAGNEDARRYAVSFKLKRASAIAAVDALTFWGLSKIPVPKGSWTSPTGALNKTAYGGATIFTGAVGEGLGEGTAQAITEGRIDNREVVAEMLIGGLGGVIEASIVRTDADAMRDVVINGTEERPNAEQAERIAVAEEHAEIERSEILQEQTAKFAEEIKEAQTNGAQPSEAYRIIKKYVDLVRGDNPATIPAETIHEFALENPEMAEELGLDLDEVRRASDAGSSLVLEDDTIAEIMGGNTGLQRLIANIQLRQDASDAATERAQARKEGRKLPKKTAEEKEATKPKTIVDEGDAVDKVKEEFEALEAELDSPFGTDENAETAMRDAMNVSDRINEIMDVSAEGIGTEDVANVKALIARTYATRSARATQAMGEYISPTELFERDKKSGVIGQAETTAKPKQKVWTDEDFGKWDEDSPSPLGQFVKERLELMAGFEEYSRRNSVRNPAYDDRVWDTERASEHRSLSAHSEEMTIYTRDIVSDQEHLWVSSLLDMTKTDNPSNLSNRERIPLVFWNSEIGKFQLQDGNHRVALHRILGKERIDVRVIHNGYDYETSYQHAIANREGDTSSLSLYAPPIPKRRQSVSDLNRMGEIEEILEDDRLHDNLDISEYDGLKEEHELLERGTIVAGQGDPFAKVEITPEMRAYVLTGDDFIDAKALGGYEQLEVIKQTTDTGIVGEQVKALQATKPLDLFRGFAGVLYEQSKQDSDLYADENFEIFTKYIARNPADIIRRVGAILPDTITLAPSAVPDSEQESHKQWTNEDFYAWEENDPSPLGKFVMERLNLMAGQDTGLNRMRNPVYDDDLYITDEEDEAKLEERSNRGLWWDEEQTIYVRDIVSSQDFFDYESILKLTKTDPSTLDEDDKPIVFWNGNDFELQDGNHRVNLYRILGRETIDVKVLVDDDNYMELYEEYRKGEDEAISLYAPPVPIRKISKKDEARIEVINKKLEDYDASYSFDEHQELMEEYYELTRGKPVKKKPFEDVVLTPEMKAHVLTGDDFTDAKALGGYEELEAVKHSRKGKGVVANAIKGVLPEKKSEVSREDIVKNLSKLSDTAIRKLVSSPKQGDVISDAVATATKDLFADAYIKYLQNNTPPTPALADVFNSISSKIIGTYSAIDSANLEPRVREALDRMNASDREIEIVSAVNEMSLFFPDAQSAGMTPKQYKSYRKAWDIAMGQAKARNMRKKVKELTAPQKEQHKKLADEYKPLVAKERVYELVYSITGETLADGSDRRIDDVARIDKEDLETYVSDLALLPKIANKNIYTAPSDKEETMPVSVVSQAFGYSDPKEMIEALTSYVPYTEQVKNYADAKYAELYEDAADEQAIQSIHASDAFEKVLLSEIKALHLIDKGKDAKLYERIAFDRLKDTPIGDLDLRKIQKDATRNAKLAVSALNKGDRAEAAKYKIRQLVQHYMITHMDKVVSKLAKQKDYVKQWQNERTKRPSVHSDYVKPINSVANSVSFGIAPTPAKQTDMTLDAVNEFLDAVKEGNETINIKIPKQLKDVWEKKKIYSRMKLSEWDAVYKFIKRLEAVGTSVKSTIIAGEKVDIDAVQDTMMKRLQNMDSGILHNAAVKYKGDLPAWHKLRKMFIEFNEALLRPTTRFHMMFGDYEDIGTSLGYSKIYVPFKEAEQDKTELTRLFREPMDKILAKMKKTKGFRKNLYRELQRPIDFLDEEDRTFMTTRYTKDTETGDLLISQPLPINTRQTYENLLVWAMNWGSKSNADALVRGLQSQGYNLHHENIEHYLGTYLHPLHWDLVKHYWQFNELSYDATEAWYEREYGVPPVKIEPRAFTLTDKDGKQHDYAGGYVPLIYNREVSGELGADAESKIGHRDGQRTTLAHHNVKTRRTTFYAVDEKLSHLRNAVHKDIHEITHMHADRWFNELFRNRGKGRDLRAEITRVWGKPFLDSVLIWAADNIRDIYGRQLDTLEKGVGFLRKNTIITRLGLNVSTTAAQILGLPFGLYMTAYHKGGSIGAVKRVQKMLGVSLDYARLMTTTSPARTALHIYYRVKGDDATRAVYDDTAMGDSLFMRQRITSFDKDLADAHAIAGSWVGKGQDAMTRLAFLPIAYAQMYVDIVAWQASYNDHIKRDVPAGMNSETAHKEAIRVADAVVEASQSSGDVSTLSQAHKNRGAMSLLMMFYTYFSAFGSHAQKLGVMVKRESGTKKAKAILEFNLYMAMYMGAEMFHESVILGEDLPDEDEDNDETLVRYFITKALSALTAHMPVVRDMVQGFRGYKGKPTGYDISPVADSLNEVLVLIDKSIKALEEDDEYAHLPILQSTTEVLGLTFGIPIRQGVRGLKSYEDYVKNTRDWERLSGWEHFIYFMRGDKASEE